MPLQHEEPPTPVHELVHTRLGGLARYRAFHTPRLAQAKPDSLSVSTPHRIALLTAADIEAGSDWPRLIGAKGWRFLVHEGDEVVAAVDTVIDENGEIRFGHINEGPLAAGMAEAIEWAEEQASVRDGSFEPILVIAPEFRVAFLLLKHRATGGNDHVIAIPPLFAGLKPRELLKPTDIADALRLMLARRQH